MEETPGLSTASCCTLSCAILAGIAQHTTQQQESAGQNPTDNPLAARVLRACLSSPLLTMPQPHLPPPPRCPALRSVSSQCHQPSGKIIHCHLKELMTQSRLHTRASPMRHRKPLSAAGSLPRTPGDTQTDEHQPTKCHTMPWSRLAARRLQIPITERTMSNKPTR